MLTSGSWSPRAGRRPSSLSPSSSSPTPTPTTELRASSFRFRAIDLGLGGDPRGRPLGANPSTRPSRQPARRAWVAAPASGHEGRLCGGAEAGEVLLASSRRPGGSWCEPSSHYKSLAALPLGPCPAPLVVNGDCCRWPASHPATWKSTGVSPLRVIQACPACCFFGSRATR